MGNSLPIEERRKLIGDRIRELRKLHHYTQEGLSYEICVTPKSVRDWEHGKAFPGYEYLVQLKDLFNVDVAYLLGDIDTPHVGSDLLMKELGLTEKAVETLRTLSKAESEECERVLDTLSLLIEKELSPDAIQNGYTRTRGGILKRLAKLCNICIDGDEGQVMVLAIFAHELELKDSYSILDVYEHAFMNLYADLRAFVKDTRNAKGLPDYS